MRKSDFDFRTSFWFPLTTLSTLHAVNSLNTTLPPWTFRHSLCLFANQLPKYCANYLQTLTFTGLNLSVTWSFVNFLLGYYVA